LPSTEYHYSPLIPPGQPCDREKCPLRTAKHALESALAHYASERVFDSLDSGRSLQANSTGLTQGLVGVHVARALIVIPSPVQDFIGVIRIA
jgi:hypothetical protein